MKDQHGFSIHEGILLLILVGVIGFVGWRVLYIGKDTKSYTESVKPEPAKNQSQPQNKYDIYPEVWAQNAYNGEGYEFKVNCGRDYQKLEECFLWDLTQVSVTDPAGITHQLNKDFNINSYSGEITRRWVLYGPVGAGLPKSGKYTFTYLKHSEKNFEQTVDYKPQIINYPTNITWRREGNDLLVFWTPPAGIKDGMWYKVIIFRKGGSVLSKQIDWDAKEAKLENLPLKPGEKAEFNVSSYFEGGYAYPASIPLTW